MQYLSCYYFSYYNFGKKLSLLITNTLTKFFVDSHSKIVYNLIFKSNKKICRTNDANNIHEIIKIYFKI